MSRVPGTFKDRPRSPVEAPFSDEEEVVRQRIGLHSSARRYALGDCTVIVAREPAGPGGFVMLWHLSISHPSRYPTWDEIKTARYELTPDRVTMAMLLPPPEEYVNVEAQDNVFHLWETDDPTGGSA